MESRITRAGGHSCKFGQGSVNFSGRNGFGIMPFLGTGKPDSEPFHKYFISGLSLMLTVNRLASVLLLGLIWVEVTPAQTNLSSVDGALELSKATGKPIFVMAGRET